MGNEAALPWSILLCLAGRFGTVLNLLLFSIRRSWVQDMFIFYRTCVLLLTLVLASWSAAGMSWQVLALVLASWSGTGMSWQVLSLVLASWSGAGMGWQLLTLVLASWRGAGMSWQVLALLLASWSGVGMNWQVLALVLVSWSGAGMSWHVLALVLAIWIGAGMSWQVLALVLVSWSGAGKLEWCWHELASAGLGAGKLELCWHELGFSTRRSWAQVVASSRTCVPAVSLLDVSVGDVLCTSPTSVNYVGILGVPGVTIPESFEVMASVTPYDEVSLDDGDDAGAGSVSVDVGKAMDGVSVDLGDDMDCFTLWRLLSGNFGLETDSLTVGQLGVFSVILASDSGEFEAPALAPDIFDDSLGVGFMADDGIDDFAFIHFVDENLCDSHIFGAW